MSTSKNNNGGASVATELERLESEKIIGESVVSVARDKYASELGNADEVERMRMIASVKPKTYKIPKRLRKKRDGNPFIERIKKLFGVPE